MKAVNLVCSTAFMMSAALIISMITNMAGLFPSDVLTSDIRSNMTILLLAVMMTISFSRIPYRNLLPTSKGKSVFRSIFLGLILSSSVPLIGYYILKDIPEFSQYAPGLVFIAAAPFAASVGPLSMVLRGDLEHALRSTVIVYIIALAWIPFIIWITLGETVKMTGVIKTVVEIIGIPLILSRLITKFEVSKTTMSIVLNTIIAFLVWLSVSSANFPGSALVLGVFFLFAVLRSFGLGASVEIVEKKSGIPWSQRVTDILMTSYKNKGIAIALCVATMGPQTPYAMVVIATSIVVGVMWVAFMDGFLFNKKRMTDELFADDLAGIKQTWE